MNTHYLRRYYRMIFWFPDDNKCNQNGKDKKTNRYKECYMITMYEIRERICIVS